MTGRRKVYVDVRADHYKDGSVRPRVIKFENGEKYRIDRLLHRCRAAATKTGGYGMRYTVVIKGTETYLFNEDNGLWFVEAKRS